MHETVIAQDIISKAMEKGTVKSITVEVGELAHLPYYELEEALNKLVKWDVNVIYKHARVKCSCGYVGRPHIAEKTHGATIFFCPECSAVPTVLKGGDIVLKEVVVK